MATEQGPVRLQPVKPCSRCQMVDVDPQAGQAGSGVLQTLRGYRADPRLDGAISFGMNLRVVEGHDAVLAVGQSVQVRMR